MTQVTFCVGAVISPCLCNIYLHRLDRQWAERGHGTLVRYADDLLAVCRTRAEAETALTALRMILAELGLELKDAKTRIVHLQEGGEGVDFLGFHHRWVRARRARHVQFLARWPSPRAMQHARDRIREITDRAGCCVQSRKPCRRSTPFLRGWAGYFRYGNSAHHFDVISDYAADRLAGHVAKRHKRPRAWGWSVLAFQSPDRLGLIDLNGTVVAPRPHRSWRGRSSRMPAVKNVGEPCAGEPHARCARDMTSSSGVRVPCGG